MSDHFQQNQITSNFSVTLNNRVFFILIIFVWGNILIEQIDVLWQTKLIFFS